MLATFLATLFLDLEFAIYTGVLLSLILYLNRTAHPRIVNMAPNPDEWGPPLIETDTECPDLKIIRIDGPLFFGSVNHVAEYLHNIDKRLIQKRNVLIVGCGINLMDVAGAEMIAHEAQRRRTQRGNLYLCDIKPAVMGVLERSGYVKMIGQDHFFPTQREAIDHILGSLNPAP